MTAGESHGEGLLVILEGIPSNLEIDTKEIELELIRRRIGTGRGKRMDIEKDELKIISGVHFGKSIGSPIGILIKNSEWEKWKDIMSIEKKDFMGYEEILYPRPGHADLPGILKYHQSDIRNILERASAREAAARVAAGAICKLFLRKFSIDIVSHIISIGKVSISKKEISYDDVSAIDKFASLRCADNKAVEKMQAVISKAAKAGDTVGGIFEVIIKNVPPGLGSYIQSDLRLDADLASAIMSIPAIKGVEIGKGFDCTRLYGTEMHDAIFYDKKRGYYRKTNNAGGIEGGISNGEEIRIKAAVKPIPTVKNALPSVNIKTKEKGLATYQRSDVCAVNPAAVIGENMAAITVAKHFLRKFGGDSIEETYKNFKNYLSLIHK